MVLKIEQIARTKVFFMIYRKFLRPRELLEMFIERFEELKEFAGDEDEEEARNTRLRYERKKGPGHDGAFFLILLLDGCCSLLSCPVLSCPLFLFTPGHLLSFCLHSPKFIFQGDGATILFILQVK